MSPIEASDLIAEVLAGDSGRACLTCSFQAEDVAVLHLLLAQRPEIPVLFLDTGYHFAETYAYRDKIASEWNLNLINLRAARTVAQQESEFGILYSTAADRCCGLRKVEPLFAGLAEYDIWFTGLRRVQSPTRANLQTIEAFPLPSGKRLKKVSPLAMWSNQEVWAYAKEQGIPLLPLYDRGYTSIGCEPCTSLPLDPNDLRSGRWAGHKLECGIHIAGTAPGA